MVLFGMKMVHTQTKKNVTKLNQSRYPPTEKRTPTVLSYDPIP